MGSDEDVQRAKYTWILNVKGIHKRSPKTNINPSLSAIMSQLQKRDNINLETVVIQLSLTDEGPKE